MIQKCNTLNCTKSKTLDNSIGKHPLISLVDYFYAISLVKLSFELMFIAIKLSGACVLMFLTFYSNEAVSIQVS